MPIAGWKVCYWMDSRDKKSRRRICVPIYLLELPKLSKPIGPGPVEEPSDPSPWRLAFESPEIKPAAIRDLSILANINALASQLTDGARRELQANARRWAHELNETQLHGELEFNDPR